MKTIVALGVTVEGSGFLNKNITSTKTFKGSKTQIRGSAPLRKMGLGSKMGNLG
jgi:hypothetical protein